MRTIQTSETFPLSSVKPLDGLLRYRAHCLQATHAALRGTSRRRQDCPVDGEALVAYGAVDGLAYARCPQDCGLFLAMLPESARWQALLADVASYRRSPQAFHAGLAQSRTDHVFAPKMAWIQDALRWQELDQPRVLEVASLPSDFTALLRESRAFAEVETVDETALAAEGTSATPRSDLMGAAVLLESLDRALDPAMLLRAVAGRLTEKGLVFVTALVASGFDFAVLGLRNVYLYPPDRTNCFSLRGLSTLLGRAGFELLEVSTPGVLDVEIVRAHCADDPTLPLSTFERQVVEGEEDTQRAFQLFLQQRALSSFARLVARKRR